MAGLIHTAGLLRRFVADYLRFARRRAALALLLTAAATALEGTGLVLLAPLLAVVTGASGRRDLGAAGALFQEVGAHSGLARLELLLGAYVGLAALRAGAGLGRDRVLGALQIGFAGRLRLGLIRRLTQAGWEQLAGLQHARVTQAINNDVPRIYSLASTLAQLAVALSMLAAAAAAALLLSPPLGGLALALLGGLMLGAGLCGRGGGGAGRALGSASRRMLHDAGQFLGALKFAFSQDLAARFAETQAEVIAALGETQLAFLRRQSLTRALGAAAAAIAAAAVAVVGYGGLHLPAATLLALVAVLSRMSGPALAAQQALQQTLYALPAYDAYLQLCAALAPGRPAEASGPSAGPPAEPSLPEGELAFHRVTYRHRDATGAPAGGVEALSFTLRPGEMAALVGPSGAGKTTAADLLMGLLTPQAGEIRIAGARLDAAALPAWRRRSAYVPQDPFLSHETLRANLLAGAPEADAAQVQAALRVSGADAVVARLPLGLDTLAGERGALLSGGERQRLALARALVRRPSLLVLDEATNALDLAAERAVFERLRGLEPRPTILVISHRRECIALCDRAIFLDRDSLDRFHPDA